MVRAATAGLPSSLPARFLRSVTRRALPACALALIVLIVLAQVLAARRVPAGSAYLGSVRAHIDEAQFLAAIRMGAAGAWLWHDPFMVHPPPPILMYPVYLGAGHLGSFLHLSVVATFAVLHVLAALALLVAVWVCGRTGLAPGDRPWFVLLALGASGFYLLDALWAALGTPPLPLEFFGGPVLSGFTMGLTSVHEALYMAGHFAALTGLLRALGAADRRERRRALRYGAVGTLLMALTLPLLLPMTFMTLAAYTAWWIRRSGRHDGFRHVRVWQYLRLVAIVGLPALPFLLYYLVVFTLSPWAQGAFRTMPELYPLPNATLISAVWLPFAAWGWYRAPARARPLATMLALWICCALLGRELPLWQSVRYTTGLNMASGALAALGMLDPGARTRRRRCWLGGLLGSGALAQYLLLLAALVAGRAPGLYQSTDEAAAMHWLAVHARAGDVVLAPYQFSNRLVIVASCRVVFGHNYQTIDLDRRLAQARIVYGQDQPVAARLAALRQSEATLVVYDRLDQEDGSFDPEHLAGLRPAYRRGAVVVLLVQQADGTSPVAGNRMAGSAAAILPRTAVKQ